MNVQRVSTPEAFQPYTLSIQVQTAVEHKVLSALMRCEFAVGRALSATLIKFTSADEAALRECMHLIYAAM